MLHATPAVHAGEANKEGVDGRLTSRLTGGGGEAAEGGYWSPQSIERRVGRQRKNAVIDPRTGTILGRTKPGPSEEEAYLAAGHPDYVAQAARIESGASAAAAATATGAADAGAAASGGKGKTGSLARSAATLQQGRQSVVQLSSGGVARSSQHAFVRTYTLLVMPAYQRLPGFLSARLLISTDAAAAPVGGPATGPEVAPEIVRVCSIVEFESAAARDAAYEDPVLRSALQQLATYMRGGPPDTSMWSQQVSYDAQWDNAAALEAVQGGHHLHDSEVGPELGLR